LLPNGQKTRLIQYMLYTTELTQDRQQIKKYFAICQAKAS